MADDMNKQADEATEKIHQEIIQLERRILLMRVVSYGLMFLAGVLTGSLTTLVVYHH